MSERRRLSIIRVWLVVSLLVAFTRSVEAGSVTLAWDPNSETDLAGYRVYYGTATRSYGTSVDVGNVTSWTVPNLTEGEQYYFAVTAYNTGGGESTYSDEVTTTIVSAGTPAAVTAPTPGSTLPGASVTFQWTAGVNVTTYRLSVGTTPGGTTLFDQTDLSGQSVTVTGLPTTGGSVYARMWSLIAGTWRFTDYTYTAFDTCQTTVSPTTRSISAAATTGTVTVTSGVGCGWTATDNVSWITFTGSTTGTGNGSVDYSVAAHTGTSSRTGVITIDGATLTITQAAATRVITLSGSLAFGGVAVGATATRTLTIGNTGSAALTVSSISYPSGFSGAWSGSIAAGGSQAVTVTFAPTNTTSYSGTVTVNANQTSGTATTPASGTGSSGAATFIQPVNGAVDVDPLTPITWTPVTGAQAYFLYIGSSLGAQDLASTGETQATSFVMPASLGGRTLFLRLHTKLAGTWRFVDATVTTRNTAAQFLTPSGTTHDMGSDVTWTTVTGAQAYYLTAGTGAGLRDLLDSGEITRTYYRLPDAAANRTVYLRLFTKLNGSWAFVDKTVTTSAVVQLSTFIQPVNGTTNFDVLTPVTWTAAPGAQAYYLYVGSAYGLKDFVDTGETQLRSYTLPASLTNRTLYLRLWTKLNNIWRYIDISITTAKPIATFINPSGATLNIDTDVTWTSINGAQAYYLYAGTAVGLKDLVDTGEITRTFQRLPDAAANRQVYLRLWTRQDNVWRYVDKVVTTSALLPAATFIQPVNGATNFDVLTPMTWTAPAGATAYYLYVGSAVGLKDLVDTGEITATSYTLPASLANRTLYLRLWTRVSSGVWKYIDATITTAKAVATFINPSGATLDMGTDVTWTTITGAQAYYLTAGTGVGLRDLLDSGEITRTYYRLPDAAANRTVYLRLFTKQDNVWRYVDKTVTTSALVPIAAFIQPVNGAVNFPVTTPVTWTPAANAQAYYLYVGSAVGLSNLANTGEIQGTSYTLPASLNGRTLYLRLWTKINGVWKYVDSVVTTQ